jgi:hypothetical protein
MYNGDRERTGLVRAAYSAHLAPEPTAPATALTPAVVTKHLASLDTPSMPTHLAAKVADAIAAESAQRSLVTAR